MQSPRYAWSADLWPLGIRTRLEADHPRLLRAALAACGDWRGAAGDDEPPLRLRLRLGGAAGGGRPPEVRVSGARLRLSGCGVRGTADAARREARCVVPPDLLADPPRLAAEVLDTLLLFLLTRAGRLPLHAAGLLVRGTAVVLAGPSGSGKSSLALAAHRAGIRVLSDDAVHLQLRPRLRVWGFPRPIHLLPTLPPPAGAPLRLRGGRWKLAVETGGRWSGPPVAERGVLCLLERGDRVALRSIGAGEAVAGVMESLEPGFDHFREQLPDALRALAAAGAWRLTLSRDPAEALAALRATFPPAHPEAAAGSGQRSSRPSASE